MSQEARGLDPKDWIVPAGDTAQDGQAHWWLFKPIKSASYRRCDDWSEKMASELAVLLGLPAAHVELASDGREGIVSQNVTPNRWSMESGDTLLSEFDGYVSCAGESRPANRVGHNLANIEAILTGCTGPPGSDCQDWSAVEVFAGYLVFDAWIANTDRHAINWGVLTNDESGQQALAASFDHGSALASGTQDPKLRSTPVETYAHRGYAGRFEEGSRLPLVDLAFAAVDRCGGRANEWMERLTALDEGAIGDIVNAIPKMSAVRRTFVSTLLETNRRRLTS